MKAIIPAAGLGTRFLPASKAVPKEMLPVLDKPTIQYVVEEALAAQADETVLIINKSKTSLIEHFSSNEALEQTLIAAGKADFAAEVHRASELPVSFIEQPNPKGLGHAVLMAADKVCGQPNPQAFYVLLGDVLVPDNTILLRMKSISDAHNNASVIAVIEVDPSEVSRFGIVGGIPLADQADVMRVTKLVEKPPCDEAPSNLAIFGRYLLSPKIMELLKTTKPGAGGEIQLTDAMIELLKHEEMYALTIDAGDGYDVGTIADWLRTNIALAKRNPALANNLSL